VLEVGLPKESTGQPLRDALIAVHDVETLVAEDPEGVETLTVGRRE
jgi:hypothetical protein